MERRRTVFIASAALALSALAIQHPTADIRLLTHDARDVAPRRFQAAVDFGVVGVSVLVTWTARQLVR